MGIDCMAFHFREARLHLRRSCVQKQRKDFTWLVHFSQKTLVLVAVSVLRGAPTPTPLHPTPFSCVVASS